MAWPIIQPVCLAYQPPASNTFLSQQISHQQPANSTFLSEQTSTSHQPPAKRTGRLSLNRKRVHYHCQGYKWMIEKSTVQAAPTL
jgi:hypothetical protein